MRTIVSTFLLLLSGFGSIYYDSHASLFSWANSAQIEWVLETVSEEETSPANVPLAHIITPQGENYLSGEDIQTQLASVSFSRQVCLFAQKVSSQKRFIELLFTLLSREFLNKIC